MMKVVYISIESEHICISNPAAIVDHKSVKRKPTVMNLQLI